MKAKSPFQLILILTFVALCFVFLTHTQASRAQEQTPEQLPPTAPSLPQELNMNGLIQTADGLWVRPAGGQPTDMPGVPQTTGGPDDYGYTWNDTEPFNWIDGTINTGLGGTTHTAGPISLPFSFKFYENSYSQLYISKYGYISFTDDYLADRQSQVPRPSDPNNVVAPHWVPALINENGYGGSVKYSSGGSAPNRYFVIEWEEIRDSYSPATTYYTFELILHENGDAVFQYAVMTYGGGGRSCAHAGIEDNEGLDGLAYGEFCQQYSSNKAVRFYRPVPSARVKVSQLHQGNFVYPGEEISFSIQIRNTGELGTDTYDLLPTFNWPTTFYAANGTTLLTDTDTDGNIDTGGIPQGGTTTIIAKVQAPPSANLGDNSAVNIVIRSSINLSKSKTAVLHTSIPAPFAQVYQDNNDGITNLYFVQPTGQTAKPLTPENDYAYYQAIAETPDHGFVSAWMKGRWGADFYVYEIEYMLVNRYGETIHEVTRLTDLSQATTYAYDESPAIAVTPDGHIAISWYRRLYNSSNGQSNYNIYLAILDSTGNVVSGPANVTNNNAWGTSSDLYVPQVLSQHLAATGNNRFLLTWEQSYYAPPSGNCTSYCSVEDVLYAVYNSDGGLVKSPTPLTNDIPGWEEGYSTPGVTALANDRFFVTFTRNGSNNDLLFAVLDSNGSTVQGITNISTDGNAWYEGASDAVQLANGNIAVAWNSYDGDLNYPIRFAVLNANYGLVSGPTQLSNAAAIFGEAFVSVTADQAGHAILTWMDYNFDYRPNLYYALVNSNGTIVTSPMVYRTSESLSNNYIASSFTGEGNASYNWSPPVGVDGAIHSAPEVAGGAPGGVATVGFVEANHSGSMATSVVLTATLDSDLTYISDSSGVTPVINGNTVVWNLPDLDFLENRRFNLSVALPSDAFIGTRYPVTFELSLGGSEANPGDNTVLVEIMAAQQLFLPAIQK
jgi:hypothetical protein